MVHSVFPFWKWQKQTPTQQHPIWFRIGNANAKLIVYGPVHFFFVPWMSSDDSLWVYIIHSTILLLTLFTFSVEFWRKAAVFPLIGRSTQSLILSRLRLFALYREWKKFWPKFKLVQNISHNSSECCAFGEREMKNRLFFIYSLIRYMAKEQQEHRNRTNRNILSDVQQNDKKYVSNFFYFSVENMYFQVNIRSLRILLFTQHRLTLFQFMIKYSKS